MKGVAARPRVRRRFPDMDRPSASERLTVLERLDLALAETLTRGADEDPKVGEAPPQVLWKPEGAFGMRWVGGLLGSRGFRIRRHDLEQILDGNPGRFRPEHQEWKLVHGLQRVLLRVCGEAQEGRAPDGWAAADLFADLTAGLARFRNNALRRDLPWDSIPAVPYPSPDRLSNLLDTLHEDRNYGDRAEDFGDLHPVRRAVRIFWRFSRIAPFPDFNLVVATVVASGYLLRHGYPPFLIDAADRSRLEGLTRGAVPERCLFLESRLLETVTARARSMK